MPLRQRIVGYPETVQEQELAAQERFLEALELLTAGYPDGAVYLFGYVAEMLLKNAYFLLTGARPADLVGPRLAPARNAADRFNRLRGISHEHYHSIRFWSYLLVETRRFQGRLLPQEVETRLCQRTRRLYQNWTIEMRYRRGVVRQREAQSVCEDATWLLENYAAF
jgi:hypothetical protein